MDLRTKRKELVALVGGIGAVAFLGGIFGPLYSISMALFLALAIWIVGTLLVYVITD